VERGCSLARAAAWRVEAPVYMPHVRRVPPSSDVSEIKGCLLEQRRPRPANNPRRSLSRGYRYSPIR
jgi:hypothetical protein